MAADSDPKDLFDIKLPEGLDDDLGGDWESAFQAEDFMLSPEDEANVFFDKETGAAEDIDLASLLESEEPKQKDAGILAPTAATAEKAQTRPLPSFLPASFVLAISQGVTWFQARPLYQKILLPGFVVFSVLLLGATFFFRATTGELAKQEATPPQQTALTVPPGATPEEENIQPEVAPPPAHGTQPDISAHGAVTGVAPPPAHEAQPAQTVSTLPKSRKKWAMPAFFIAGQQENGKESVLVRIDLSLTLLLEPGVPIPEEKRLFVRDTIFQFFANRPPDELRRYALARGEMIRNLDSWLKKEWPQNPIASVMFDRYQIIK
ncbi:MAG: hypothetical protein HY885_08860 [Deltaproteobacteria bacterium]|nr:hypothetical protein [Deltaproteobacteria bacterium]